MCVRVVARCSSFARAAELEDFAVLSFLQDTLERSRQLVSAYKAGAQDDDGNKRPQRKFKGKSACERHQHARLKPSQREVVGDFTWRSCLS